MKKTLLFLAAALTFGMAANAQTIYSEDFENVTLDNNIGTLPTGWTTYEDNLTNFNNGSYDYRPFGNSWCVYNMNGWGKCAFCMTYTNEATQVDRWMITPQITIPATGDYSLTFNVYGSNYHEMLRVLVSTTGTAKTDFTQTLFEGELDAGLATKLLSLASYAGQDIYIAFQNYTTDGLYTFVDDIEVRVVAANSISAVSATAAPYTAQNGNCNVNLNVYNEGSAALTSFDLAYTVNGGDEQTLSVTGINVAPFTVYTYSFPVQMTTLGAATIAITVSNPNGVTDVDASDNSTSTTTNVYDPSSTAERTSLLEHFTTARCQYCPDGHDRLEQAMNGYEDRICWVAHHVGFYTDNMTISESQEIMALYGGNSTWAPAMAIDRNVEFADGAEDGGVVGSVGYVADLVNQFQAATSTPAFVTVNLSNLSYDAQSRQLTVTVSGSFLADYVGSPTLSLFITQDGIRASQSSTSGTIQNYEHNHVIRACISDTWGDADAFNNTTAGSTFTKTFTYTLPTKFSANACRLVAFVSDYGADMLHRTVANATKSGYLLEGADPTTGIGDVQASMQVVTYPNPATEMAYVSAEGRINSYEMVDAMGRKVMNQENLNADILELNVSSLSAGIYFITITTDKGVATERLTVVK